MSFTSLYPTPIWHLNKNKEHPSDSLSWALSIEKETSASISNKGGFQSLGETSFDKFPFFEYIKEKLSFLPPVEYGNWWVNINRKGNYNIAHTHPGTDLSVVWYLTNNFSSPIRFISPFQYERSKLYALMGLHSEHIFKCDVGDILVFPGDLMHYVEQNESDEPRVTVSFNLKFS